MKKNIRQANRNVHRIAFSCALIFVFNIFVFAGAGEKSEVKINKLVEIKINNNIAYSVDYLYSFPERETIYVSSLGTVRAKGSFNYFTFEKQLEFLDAAGGRKLMVVLLDDPIRLMGGRSLDFPTDFDFPDAFRSGRWRYTKPFAERATDVLNNRFPSGHVVYANSGRNIYRTSYRSLPELPKRLHGKIAVQVSSPVDEENTTLEFRLQFSVRERRSHSEWRPAESKPVVESAHQFIDLLINDLQKIGG
jgi:hypothetical protein